MKKLAFYLPVTLCFLFLSALNAMYINPVNVLAAGGDRSPYGSSFDSGPNRNKPQSSYYSQDNGAYYYSPYNNQNYTPRDGYRQQGAPQSYEQYYNEDNSGNMNYYYDQGR